MEKILKKEASNTKKQSDRHKSKLEQDKKQNEMMNRIAEKRLQTQELMKNKNYFNENKKRKEEAQKEYERERNRREKLMKESRARKIEEDRQKLIKERKEKEKLYKEHIKPRNHQNTHKHTYIPKEVKTTFRIETMNKVKTNTALASTALLLMTGVLIAEEKEEMRWLGTKLELNSRDLVIKKPNIKLNYEEILDYETRKEKGYHYYLLKTEHEDYLFRTKEVDFLTNFANALNNYLHSEYPNEDLSILDNDYTNEDLSKIENSYTNEDLSKIDNDYNNDKEPSLTYTSTKQNPKTYESKQIFPNKEEIKKGLNLDFNSETDNLILKPYIEDINNLEEDVIAMDVYIQTVLAYEDKAESLEKQGLIDEAKILYEKVVNDYKFAGDFPYRRLRTIYNKEKKYDEIVRICDLEINNIGNIGYLKGKYLLIRTNTTPKNNEDLKGIKRIKNNALKKLKKEKEEEQKNKLKERKTKDEEKKLSKQNEKKEKNQEIGENFERDLELSQELEKENKTNEAIKLYESITRAKYPEKLPYYRLCILYRKKKNYKKELTTCNKAIRNIKNKKQKEWFKERKIKVQEKLDKQDTKKKN